MAGYCTNCGSLLPEDARFCENCGAPVNRMEAGNGKLVWVLDQVVYTPSYSYPDPEGTMDDAMQVTAYMKDGVYEERTLNIITGETTFFSICIPGAVIENPSEFDQFSFCGHDPFYEGDVKQMITLYSINGSRKFVNPIYGIEAFLPKMERDTVIFFNPGNTAFNNDVGFRYRCVPYDDICHIEVNYITDVSFDDYIRNEMWK